MKQELVEEIVRRAMAALQYTAFDNPDQNNEFELKVTSNAIYFIPIMPTTYVIDESFYYKIYNILNISLISTLTMIRPLSMQIRILPDNEPSKQSALYYPMHPGRSKRLVGPPNQYDTINGQNRMESPQIRELHYRGPKWEWEILCDAIPSQHNIACLC